MKYIATILFADGSMSKTCSTAAEAQQWLDENNNNLEHTTIIDEYDNNWWKVGGYIYTQGTS